MAANKPFGLREMKNRPLDKKGNEGTIRIRAARLTYSSLKSGGLSCDASKYSDEILSYWCLVLLGFGVPATLTQVAIEDS